MSTENERRKWEKRQKLLDKKSSRRVAAGRRYGAIVVLDGTFSTIVFMELNPWRNSSLEKERVQKQLAVICEKEVSCGDVVSKYFEECFAQAIGSECQRIGNCEVNPWALFNCFNSKISGSGKLFGPEHFKTIQKNK